jgi:hypothetical protein
MTDEKGHIRRDLEKINPGGVTVIGIIIMAVIAVVIAAMLVRDEISFFTEEQTFRKGPRPP